MNTKIMYSTIALGLAATLSSATETLINDFETSSGESFAYDHNGWDGEGSIGNEYVFDDFGNKQFTVRLKETAAGGSKYGIGVLKGEGDVGFTLGTLVDNVGDCSVISYDYKGAAHRLAVIYENDNLMAGDFRYSALLPSSDTWTEGKVILSEIRRESDEEENNQNSSDIVQFRWDVTSYSSKIRYLYVDNVKCVTPEKYKVTFKNGKTVLEEKQVFEGLIPEYTGETPQKASSEKYDYFFNGWKPAIAAVKKDVTYKAQFDSVPIFKIAPGETVVIDDFEDGDSTSNWGGKYSAYTDEKTNSEIEFKVVSSGKNKNVKIDYKLKQYAGFNLPLVKTGFRDLTPCNAVKYDYKGARHSFRLQSTIDVNYAYHERNVDESDEWKTETIELLTLTQPYYAIINADIKDVIKQANGFEWQFGTNYNDGSGSLEIDNIRCSSLPEYTITFKNGDKIVETKKVLQGVMPECSSCYEERKSSSEMYDYSFHNNWEPELVLASKDAVYQMKWSESLRQFDVTFVDDADNILNTVKVQYGNRAMYYGKTPTKEPTAEFSYTFKGWTPEFGAITQDTKYTAVFSSTKNKYTVTFKNDNGTELSSGKYEYGMSVSTIVPAENPTKDPENNVTYIFDGWSPDVEGATVTGDAVYTAMYKTSDNKYTITFMDGDVVLQQTLVEAGKIPVCENENLPTRENNAQYTYEFLGWDKEVVAAEKSTTYMAKFKVTENKYKITFKDDNGKVLDSKEYVYGTTVEKIAVPEIVRNEEVNNEFFSFVAASDEYISNYDCSWPEIKPVTKKATYTAKCKYRVTFVYNDDGGYKSAAYSYGETPVYSGPEPTKDWDKTYGYYFKGWDKEIGPVGQHSVTYRPQFEAFTREYTIAFDVEGNFEPTKYKAGTKVADIKVPKATRTATDKCTYTFVKWTPELTDVWSDVIYTPVFDCAVNKYAIKFVVDGKTVGSTMYAYGTTAEEITEPKVENKVTDKYTYTFKSWDKTITDVKKDVTYTAKFDSTLNKYVVKFVSDGEVLSSKEYTYGTKAADVKAPKAKKDATAKYTYTFKSWDKTITDVKKDVTYTAKFDSTLNKYVVKFVSDGEVLSSTKYAYGTKAADVKAPKAKKDATAKYTYTFKSWDKTIADVKKDVTYTAKFDSTVNKYYVKFVVEGKTVDSTMYAYGTKAKNIKTPKNTPEKKATKDSTYTFDKWSPEITDVKGDATYKAKFKAKKKSSAIGQVVQSNFKYSFAGNELTVYMPKSSMVRVQVYDMAGHLVTSFNEYVAGSKVFSLDKLKRGVYQVRIISKSQTRSARISVK